jgi:hypothetical protein
MLIDHVGLLFFPDDIGFRIIGRLAMPMFSYCIARGFYFTSLKGTVNAYIKRMAVFAVLSQIPFMIMENEIKGNIGVLWFLCLVFLKFAEKDSKKTTDYFILAAIAVITAFVPMDYGIYGLFFTVVLYYFFIKKESSLFYPSYFLLHGLNFVRGTGAGIMQLFTLPAIPLLDLLKRYDDKVKIDRRFFYAFYPVHMLILVGIKSLSHLWF